MDGVLSRTAFRGQGVVPAPAGTGMLPPLAAYFFAFSLPSGGWEARRLGVEPGRRAKFFNLAKFGFEFWIERVWIRNLVEPTPAWEHLIIFIYL